MTDFLPNLCNLNITSINAGEKRNRSSSTDDENDTISFQVPNGRVGIMDIDWKLAFDQFLSQNPHLSYKFTFYSPFRLAYDGSLRTQTFTMQWNLETTLEIRSGEHNEPCVELEYNNDDLYISSLFASSKPSVIKSCEMKPSHLTESGAGDFAMSIFHCISAKSGKEIQLSDQATSSIRWTGREDESWIFKIDGLSTALSVVRGVSFYERRGFMKSFFADAVLEEFESNPSVIPNMLLKTKQVFLEWTHLITTTPIEDLDVAIRNFDEIVNKILGSDRTILSALRDTFSTSKLNAHVDFLQDTETATSGGALINLKRAFKDIAFKSRACPERFGYSSFEKMSIRLICQLALVDKTEFKGESTTWIDEFADEIAEAVSVFMKKAWKQIGDRSLFLSFMTCNLFKMEDDSYYYVGVETDIDPTRPPVAKLKRIDDSFMVFVERGNSKP